MSSKGITDKRSLTIEGISFNLHKNGPNCKGYGKMTESEALPKDNINIDPVEHKKRSNTGECIALTTYLHAKGILLDKVKALFGVFAHELIQKASAFF